MTKGGERGGGMEASRGAILAGPGDMSYYHAATVLTPAESTYARRPGLLYQGAGLIRAPPLLPAARGLTHQHSARTNGAVDAGALFKSDAPPPG